MFFLESIDESIIGGLIQGRIDGNFSTGLAQRGRLYMAEYPAGNRHTGSPGQQPEHITTLQSIWCKDSLPGHCPVHATAPSLAKRANACDRARMQGEVY